MLKIKLLNGHTYPVLPQTTVYPNYSQNVRNKMEIHMAVDSMTIVSFETLLSKEDNTKSICLSDDSETSGFSTVYENYTVLSEVSKKNVSEVNVATGEVKTEVHLVAVLEQLTQLEQKLKEVGLL